MAKPRSVLRSTVIKYTLVADCGSKEPLEIIVGEEVTKGQITFLNSTCEKGQFIPSRIGLPAKEPDAPHTICEISSSVKDPTVSITMRDLIGKIKCGNNFRFSLN